MRSSARIRTGVRMVRIAPPTRSPSVPDVVDRLRFEVDRTLDRGQVHAGSIGGSGRLLPWREELGECSSERLGMGQGGGVPDAGYLVYPCVRDVVGHVP